MINKRLYRRRTNAIYYIQMKKARQPVHPSAASLRFQGYGHLEGPIGSLALEVGGKNIFQLGDDNESKG